MNILFICKDNALYSQLAEALTNNLHKGNIKAYSAGFAKAESVNPYLMKLLGKYMNDGHTPFTKSVEEIPDIKFDYVITINAFDYFPKIQFSRKLEWRIASSDENTADAANHIAQLVSAKVQSLILNLAA